MARRTTIAVIGAGDATPQQEALAEALGRLLVDAGHRVVCGGKGGVMAAVCRGGRASERWSDGDLVGILPGDDASEANPWVDLALPTGLGIARNVLVVRAADAVVAIGGASGTLSELALAWQLGRPVVALDAGGWASRLAGTAVDARRDDVVHPASDPEAAVALVGSLLRRS